MMERSTPAKVGLLNGHGFIVLFAWTYFALYTMVDVRMDVLDDVPRCNGCIVLPDEVFCNTYIQNDLMLELLIAIVTKKKYEVPRIPPGRMVQRGKNNLKRTCSYHKHVIPASHC